MMRCSIKALVLENNEEDELVGLQRKKKRVVEMSVFEIERKLVVTEAMGEVVVVAQATGRSYKWRQQLVMAGVDGLLQSMVVGDANGFWWWLIVV
ncbi:hypothetical protein Acr_21g0000460 [Actinidia rufa]|uniref:Uncharacterized protein n=1 Tax=Actinidia rufa TaxID=165716 RepID=A0A7J0GF60_9ERIC|nr:hypothetical protein Acr_21g0000460 [Actinidia rufa]